VTQAQAAGEVDDCPCGSQHAMSWKSWVAYERVTEGKPPAVMVATPEGRWLVPRIYIACHGLKAACGNCPSGRRPTSGRHSTTPSGSSPATRWRCARAGSRMDARRAVLAWTRPWLTCGTTLAARSLLGCCTGRSPMPEPCPGPLYSLTPEQAGQMPLRLSIACAEGRCEQCGAWFRCDCHHHQRTGLLRQHGQARHRPARWDW
jgi:hypothetical protein